MTDTESNRLSNEEESFLDETNSFVFEDEYSGVITLVGTVHVSKETRKRVIETINNMKPDVVAIELDSDRLYSMFERNADIVQGDVSTESGFRDLLRKNQAKMFDKEGLLKPGEADMLPAANTATELGSRIALIDMSIDELKSQVKSNVFPNGQFDLEILNKSSDEIIQSIMDLFKSRKDMASKMQNEGISSIVENMENKPISDVKKQFEPLENLAPEFVNALIDERDKYMSGRLHWLRKNGYDVVSVMGRGHIEGVYYYLSNPNEIPTEYVTEPDWYGYEEITISN